LKKREKTPAINPGRRKKTTNGGGASKKDNSSQKTITKGGKKNEVVTWCKSVHETIQNFTSDTPDIKKKQAKRTQAPRGGAPKTRENGTGPGGREPILSGGGGQKKKGEKREVVERQTFVFPYEKYGKMKRERG